MPDSPRLKTPIIEANLLLAVMAGDSAQAKELMALLPKDVRVILAVGCVALAEAIEEAGPAPQAASPAPSGLTQFCEPNALLATLLGDAPGTISAIAALPAQNRAWLHQASLSLASLCAQP